MVAVKLISATKIENDSMKKKIVNQAVMLHTFIDNVHNRQLQSNLVIMNIHRHLLGAHLHKMVNRQLRIQQAEIVQDIVMVMANGVFRNTVLSDMVALAAKHMIHNVVNNKTINHHNSNQVVVHKDLVQAFILLAHSVLEVAAVCVG